MTRYIAILLAGLLLGWLAQGWRMGEQIAGVRAEHETQLRQAAQVNAAVILQQQADRLELESRLAQLDQIKTTELTDAQNENDRLRRLYSDADTERRRLRIEVRVATADAVVSATTGPSSLGDAASVELSADAGRAVWDIRELMIRDQEKIKYLQGYLQQITEGTKDALK